MVLFLTVRLVFSVAMSAFVLHLERHRLVRVTLEVKHRKLKVMQTKFKK